MSYINPTKVQKVQTNFTRKTGRKLKAHHENKALQTTHRTDTMEPAFKNSAHQIGPSYTARRTRRRSPTRNAAAQEKILEFPPPPAGFNKELWDLQFSRWWGWNWVRKQEEENLRKNTLLHKRNISNPSQHYITPRPKIEPYKENRFQQFCKFMKDIYSTAKTKITEKTIEPRIKHSYYTMHHPKKKRQESPPPRKMYKPPQFYIGQTAARQNSSISSLFVQAESRHKKYKRTQRNVDSWIVERSESSSSEEGEKILTCMSVAETYTSSTEGDVNYLAARMKKICNNDNRQKERPRKYIFVRNKGTQSNLNKEETLTKLCNKSVEEMKIESVAVNKVDATTETSAGLVDKEHFASPLTGHLYKINIPEIPIPEVKYPSTDNMFDFIKETDLKTPPDLNKNTEHQKLLNAVYEALLTSRERPVMNHYYDDSYEVHNERISSGTTTKKIFVGPKMVSSSSFHDFSSSEDTGTPTTLRDLQFAVKRKSAYNSNSTSGSDILPPKSFKKSIKEPSSSTASSRKRLLNNRRTTKINSPCSSSPETSECLPVILEDASINSANNNRKKQHTTNPSPRSSRASSGIENYCKLQRDNNTTAQYSASDAKSLRTEMEQSKVSVGSQKKEEEDAMGTTSASQTTSAITKHSWNVTLNVEKGGMKSNIPIAVHRNVSNTKKRKLN